MAWPSVNIEYLILDLMTWDTLCLANEKNGPAPIQDDGWVKFINEVIQFSRDN